jgi:hypothetical protein
MLFERDQRRHSVVKKAEQKNGEVLSWLTINETVHEEETSKGFFCSVRSHVYIGEPKIGIVDTTK